MLNMGLPLLFTVGAAVERDLHGDPPAVEGLDFFRAEHFGNGTAQNQVETGEIPGSGGMVDDGAIGGRSADRQLAIGSGGKHGAVVGLKREAVLHLAEA